MFGIGTPELIGIILVILLVYGPDKMPAMIKKVMGFVRHIRQVTDEVSSSVSREVHRIEREVDLRIPSHLVEREAGAEKEKQTSVQVSNNPADVQLDHTTLQDSKDESK